VIDPTKEGLQKLIAACKFPDDEPYCFNDDIHTSITDFFSNINLHQESMLEKCEYTPGIYSVCK
jgi:hypothetical protein